MKTKELRAIWAEIEEVTRAADARSRAAMIEEKLPELWVARYDVEDAVLSDASKDLALNRITEMMRERKPQDVETHENGKVTGGLSSTIQALLHSRRDRKIRIAWMGLAASLLLLGLIWYAFELPGAPGFKNWMAGGKGSKANQIQPLPQLPESPRIFPDKSAPAPETPKTNEDAPELRSSPKTAPKKAAPPQVPKTRTPKPPPSEGMLAQRAAVGKFTSVMGEPTVTYFGEKKSFAALPNKPITTAMRIETGDTDKLEFRFNDGTAIALDFNTTVEVPSGPPALRPKEIRLLKGHIVARVEHLRRTPSFIVKTDPATAEVVGTVFSLEVESAAAMLKDLRAILQVKEGKVAFYNAYGRVLVGSSTESTALSNAAPEIPRTRPFSFTIPGTGVSSFTFGNATLTEEGAAPSLAFPLGWVGAMVRSEGGEVYVTRVMRDSPAERSGIQSGDIVLDIDGLKLQSSLEFSRLIFRSQNKALTWKVRRGEEVFETKVASELLGDPKLPSDPFVSNVLAGASYAGLTANRSQARAQLQALYVSHPHPAIRNNIGVLFEMDADLIKAARYYAAAIEGDSSIALYRRNLGRVLRYLGNMPRALEELRMSYHLDLASWEAADNLASILSQLGAQTEAMLVLEEALRRNPKATELLRTTVEILFTQGKFADAVEAAQRAIEIDPENDGAWAVAARAFFFINDRTKCEHAFRKALELSPAGVQQGNDFGAVLIRWGRYEEAIPVLKQLIRYHPGFGHAYVHLSNAFLKLGRLDEAKEASMAAVKVYPNSPASYLSVARVSVALGRFDEAVPPFEKAISLDPGLTLVYREYGDLLERLGRKREAETQFRKAIAQDPKHALTHVRLAQILIETGRLHQAKAELVLAIEMSARDPGAKSMALVGLGGVQEKLLDLEAARTSYREAISIDPTNKVAIESLRRLGG